MNGPSGDWPEDLDLEDKAVPPKSTPIDPDDQEITCFPGPARTPFTPASPGEGGDPG